MSNANGKLTFVEIVTVMNVQVPSANVGDAHVVPTQFGCLNFPQYVGARGVFVTNFDSGRRHSVNALPK